MKMQRLMELPERTLNSDIIPYDGVQATISWLGWIR